MDGCFRGRTLNESTQPPDPIVLFFGFRCSCVGCRGRWWRWCLTPPTRIITKLVLDPSGKDGISSHSGPNIPGRVPSLVGLRHVAALRVGHLGGIRRQPHNQGAIQFLRRLVQGGVALGLSRGKGNMAVLDQPRGQGDGGGGRRQAHPMRHGAAPGIGRINAGVGIAYQILNHSQMTPQTGQVDGRGAIARRGIHVGVLFLNQIARTGELIVAAGVMERCLAVAPSHLVGTIIVVVIVWFVLQFLSTFHEKF